MIGLASLGRIRPWRLNAAVTALGAAFPGAKVHIRHYDPRAGFADFVVSQPIVITEETRELLTVTTSWGSRRLRVAADVLNACEHEAAIKTLITVTAPKMERGAVVEIGLKPAESENAKPTTETRPAVAESASIQRQGGPRLGHRVDPDELPRLLRRVRFR